MQAPLPPTTRLWITLDRVHNVLGRRIHNKMAQFNLTAPQYGVLRRLGEGGTRTAQALAQDMGVTPGNLTGVVDRLEQCGLVRRDRSDADRRSVLLQLTEAGQALHDRSVPEVRRYVAELFAPLTPEETRFAQTLLERLEAHLQREEVSA